MSELVTRGGSGPVPVARVAGEIDLANATRVRDDVLALIVEDAEGLVVDLTDVSYLDSSGVQVLFQLAQELGQRDQSLVVSVPTGSPLRRLLKITGFHELAQISDNTEAAIDLIARPPGKP